MKRKIFIAIALVIGIQLMSISAFAVNRLDNEISVISAEIKEELAFAEGILGAPCRLETEKTEIVGDYVVESRLYVVDSPVTRADSGKVGGISAHLWYPVGSSTWTIKVLLAGFFYYNGTTAICIPEETDLWAVDSSNEPITSGFGNEGTSYHDGSTAKVSCSYAYFQGSQPIFSSTLNVTCSKTGQVGYGSEDKTYT